MSVESPKAPPRPTESAVKQKIRNSWLIQVIRPARQCYWDCREFVLDRLSFLTPGLPTRLLVTAMPKSGTHLITEAVDHLDEIGREPLLLDHRRPIGHFARSLKRMAFNRYAYGHVGANRQTVRAVLEARLSVIVMVRDPRDAIVSHIDHAYRLKPSVLREYYASLADDRERLKAAIRGVPPDRYPRDAAVAEAGGYDMLTGYAGIGTVCRSYLAWAGIAGVRTMFVHYRDLIGEKGGGTRERQRETVARVIEFIGLKYDDARIDRLCDKIYNPQSPTFNQGGQGRWRELFDGEIKDLFKKHAGRELIEMGYERDDRW